MLRDYCHLYRLDMLPNKRLCFENLRMLGFHEAAREFLTWLPRTPGTSYVFARLWLGLGRADTSPTG